MVEIMVAAYQMVLLVGLLESTRQMGTTITPGNIR